MLTSKQRAALRSCANKIETIQQVGKEGINENLIIQVDQALTKRELIKLRALENCPLSARDAAFSIAEKTNSESVQIIGTRFVLFRRNPEKGAYDELLK